MGFGFIWRGQWRIEWKSRHEYWMRSQFGPFYCLHSYGKKYWEDYDREMAAQLREDDEE